MRVKSSWSKSHMYCNFAGERFLESFCSDHKAKLNKVLYFLFAKKADSFTMFILLTSYWFICIFYNLLIWNSDIEKDSLSTDSLPTCLQPSVLGLAETRSLKHSAGLPHEGQGHRLLPSRAHICRKLGLQSRRSGVGCGCPKDCLNVVPNARPGSFQSLYEYFVCVLWR